MAKKKKKKHHAKKKHPKKHAKKRHHAKKKRAHARRACILCGHRSAHGKAGCMHVSGNKICPCKG